MYNRCKRMHKSRIRRASKREGLKMEKKNWLTLKTKAGCWHLFLILVAAILVFSFCAQMITTRGGHIKVQKMTIDARGAKLEGDLYYPAGISDEDKLPAVIVVHGGGVNKGNYKGIAEELARREFVVFNVNAYGTSGSEMPPYDEYDQGVEGYNSFGSSCGVLDAVEFLRTLQFVDQTRIGIAGHSMGSMKAEFAAMLDDSYLTFNDLMINVLYDTFGQTFTEEEITMDADGLAKARLTEDQLAYYEYIRAEKKEWFDTRIRSVLIIGTPGSRLMPRKEVSVAGYTVKRSCQVNAGTMSGTYDSMAYVTSDYGLDALYMTGEIATDTWYAIDDVGQKSTIVGTINDSVADNAQMKAAMDNRQARFVTYNRETHSKNFFSVATTADAVVFMTQTLEYNCGDLTDPATKPIDPASSVFVLREIFNFLAMCAMLAMLVPLAAILCKTSFFAACVGKNEPNGRVFSKKRYWLISVIALVVGFLIILWINGNIMAPRLYSSDFFPLWPAFWLAPIFLGLFAAVSLIELAVCCAIDKKRYGSTNLPQLNIGLGLKGVLKSLLMAFILVLAGYATLALVKYLFNQDYRMWMFAFDELKVEHWWYVLLTMAFTFVQLAISGAMLNYHRRTDIPEWLDELLTVLFNSIGIWLVALINILVLHSGGAMFSNWQFTYQFLLAVPVTVYLCRRLYKVTRSVWLGAFVTGLILGWSFVAPAGYIIYHAPGWFSVFFHI